MRVVLQNAMRLRRVGTLRLGWHLPLLWSLKTFPSLIPGPDSVDICAIARPGGNQIIFKPEIIFFIIVTDSIFFLFSVTRCVCTYIYYKYQRNYISILGWENKGGIYRYIYIYIKGGGFSSLSLDQQEKRDIKVFLFSMVPSLLSLLPTKEVAPSAGAKSD